MNNHSDDPYQTDATVEDISNDAIVEELLSVDIPYHTNINPETAGAVVPPTTTDQRLHQPPLRDEDLNWEDLDWAQADDSEYLEPEPEPEPEPEEVLEGIADELRSIPTTPRGKLLTKALELVDDGERNERYGDPIDNFTTTARMWSEYLDARLSSRLQALGEEGIREAQIIEPADFPLMMILAKVARAANDINHYDNLLDIAGYAATAAECIQIKEDSE